MIMRLIDWYIVSRWLYIAIYSHGWQDSIGVLPLTEYDRHERMHYTTRSYILNIFRPSNHKRLKGMRIKYQWLVIAETVKRFVISFCYS